MNTQPTPHAMTHQLWKYFTLAIGLCLLLVQNSPATDSFKIEEAQRAFQERYGLVFGTGNVVTWPARSDSTPAPSYPPEGFYDSDVTNAAFAASLVQDLASKLNNADILERFVTPADGDISNSQQIPVFSTTGSISTDPAKLVVGAILSPVTSVTSDNYPGQFSILTGYICKLNHIWVQASQQAKVGRYAVDFNATCAGAESCLIATVPAMPWDDFYCMSDCTVNEEDPGFAPSGSIMKGIGITGNPYGGDLHYVAGAIQVRGKIGSDLSGFPSGSAKAYLQLDACWGFGEFICGELGFGCGDFGQSRPTSTPADTYGLWSNATVQVGVNWLSDYVPESQSGLSNSACPSPPADLDGAASGWYLQDQVIVVSPDYQNTVSSCQPCTTCSQGSCSEPGGAFPDLGSINYRIGLGLGLFGKTAGQLLINADQPSPLLSTPQSLRYQAASFDQVITTNGTLRQLLAPQALVDVVPTNAFQYEIRFYTAANAGSFSGGLYHPSGSPYKTFVVANPDASTNTYNRLTVTENSQGVSTVTEYDWSDASQQWQMITGNGAGYQTHSYVWDASHSNRTDTIIISNSTGQVISKQIQSYHVFPWGTELVQQQIDPDGANLTTAWSYYDSVPSTNANYSRLKQAVEPSGHWTTYQYDQYGRTTKTVVQFLDSSLGSADNLNRVTTTTYSDSVPQETIVETALGHETSRRYRVYHPNEIDDIQCQTAGAAWNAADNLVTVTKTVAGGLFEGDVQSIVNPDGTMSLYQYSTNSTSATITVNTGQPNSGGSAIVDGTRTVTVVDNSGNQLSSATYDIVSGLVLSSNVTTQTDDFGRPTTVVGLDGTRQTVYGCCGLQSTTDPEGITTSYTYDALKRTVTTTRAGITTSNSYDAAGNVLSTVRIGSDSSAIKQNTSTYDLAGRLTSSTDGVTNTTSYSEVIDGSGHRIKTTTYPDSTTRVETYYQDGQLLSMTGTAVHGARYVYGADSNGSYVQEIKLNSGTDTSESTTTYTDLAGRAYKTIYADSSSSQSYYNNQGQLVKQVDPDGVTALFSYNAKGEQVTTAIDMNQNGSIDVSGSDRITSNATSVVSAHGGIVRRTSTWVWSESGPVLTLVADVRNDGLASWTIGYGLTNVAQTVYNGSGSRTVTTTNPDGSYTVGQYQNGLLGTNTLYDSTSAQLSRTTYSYDPHGRLTTATDARTGATTSTYDNADRTTSVSASSQTTSYSYDGLGRQTQITLPDSGTVNSEYFGTGELKKTYGARTYPVAYTYDYAGRMKTIQTWQNYAGNSGTATTSWNYDVARGFLASKVYNDSSSVTYSNSAAGKLLKRTWARGITTSYAYNNAADLGTITYSDGTPSVVSTYDRRGRKTSVAFGTNTSSYAYNDAGQLLTESFPNSGVVITNSYDSLLRRSTLAGASLSLSYRYDNASRLSSVSFGTLTASYAYLPNSTLVSNIVFKNSGVTKMTMIKSYDNLNRLTSVSSTPSASSVLSYSYSYNSANQRTQVTLADGSYWVYAYDSLGQITSGQKYWGDATPVAGQQFGYAFDTIGNRQTTTANGNTGTYTANTLNQYTQRTVPGAVWELGNATNTATVTVNLQATTRKGQYFSKQFSVDNSSSAVYTQLMTVAVLKNAGTNQDDILTATTGKVFVAKSPEQFGYDADGNLTNDGRWAYQWDPENRLVQMQTLTNLPTNVPQQKLLFGYDYMGRRVSKVVSNFNGSTWSEMSNLRFVYDGLNLVAEIGKTNNLARAYAWGLDLSGTEQGAGGVGGLLGITGASGTYIVANDGNGNVTALVDANNGTVSAQFEFSPFGETLRATGAATSVSPFRFSTKYTDVETGLIMYQLRSYLPVLGRWLSRDSYGEQECPNLLAFVNNEPVAHIDTDGRSSYPPSSPPAPGSSTKDVVGGDITETLQRTRIDIRQTYRATPWPTRKCACKRLYSLSAGFWPWTHPSALNAWDIQELHDANDGIPAALGQWTGVGNWGKDKVQLKYAGQVRIYQAGDVNYTMWGVMNALCYLDFMANAPSDADSFTLEHAVSVEREYRAQYGAARQAGGEAFTRYGYIGSSPASAAFSLPPNALANPSSVLPWNVFNWVWSPIRERGK